MNWLLAAPSDADEGGDGDGDAEAERDDAEPGFDVVEVAGDESEHGAAAADDAFAHVGEVLEVDDLRAAHAMGAGVNQSSSFKLISDFDSDDGAGTARHGSAICVGD